MFGKKETTTIKKRKPIRAFFKSFVDVKKWVSYDELFVNVKTTFGLLRRIFSHGVEPVRQETYEESVARLNMTDEQLAKRKKVFLYSALIYFVFAAILFVYFIYLTIHAHFYAAFFSLVLLSLMSITAYREHFWYMQMQKRKLGCNFHDWLAFVLRKK